MNTKLCTSCHKDLLFDMFHKNKTTKDGLSFLCKNCANAAKRRSYRKHGRSKDAETQLRNRKLRQDYVLDYLEQHPCVKCGETDIRVLEFNHIDPSQKYFEVSRLLQNYGMQKLIDEIDKCEVLCANCHAKHTSEQNNSYRYQRYIGER